MRQPSQAALFLLPLVAPLGGCFATAATDPASAAKSIDADSIRAHVAHLASDELAGRYSRSPEGLEAAQYVAAQLEAAGVEPLGEEDTWFRWLDDVEVSPNVVGILRGTGSGYFVLTAHYDHLKPLDEAAEGEDRIFNGADDNASGTAAVIEIARAFAALDERPAASIVFVGFTAEEQGLRGSRHFVAHPPFPLEEIRGVINMDMISRGEENLVFCEGAAQSPELRAAVERANATVGLEIRFDTHPDWLEASDHHPFMRKGVPTLYFGVEDHEDYHRVSDHADKILAGLAAKIARLAFLTAWDVAAPPAAAGAPSTGS